MAHYNNQNRIETDIDQTGPSLLHHFHSVFSTNLSQQQIQSIIHYIIVSQIVRLQKFVYRLIIMFLPTEIFSKRRKIYSWMKRNQSAYLLSVSPSIYMTYICYRLYRKDIKHHFSLVIVTTTCGWNYGVITNMQHYILELSISVCHHTNGNISIHLIRS